MSDGMQPTMPEESGNKPTFVWKDFLGAAVGVVATVVTTALMTWWLHTHLVVGLVSTESDATVARHDFVVVRQDAVPCLKGGPGPDSAGRHDAVAYTSAYAITNGELKAGLLASGTVVCLWLLYLGYRPRKRLCRGPQCEYLGDRNASLDRAQQRLREAEEQLRHSERHVSKIEAELHGLASLQERQEAELGRSENKVASLTTEHRKAAVQADALRAELAATRSTNVELQESVRKAEESTNRTRQERDDAIHEMERNRTQLAETEASIRQHQEVLEEYHGITGRVFDILADILYQSRPRTKDRGYEWLRSDEARQKEVAAKYVWVICNDLETDARRLAGRIEDAIRNNAEYRYLVGDGSESDSDWDLLRDKVGATVDHFREQQLQRASVPRIRFEGFQVVFLQHESSQSFELYIFFPILFDGNAQTVDTLRVVRTRRNDRLPEALFQGVQGLWAIANRVVA